MWPFIILGAVLIVGSVVVSAVLWEDRRDQARQARARSVTTGTPNAGIPITSAPSGASPNPSPMKVSSRRAAPWRPRRRAVAATLEAATARLAPVPGLHEAI